MSRPLALILSLTMVPLSACVADWPPPGAWACSGDGCEASSGSSEGPSSSSDAPGSTEGPTTTTNPISTQDDDASSASTQVGDESGDDTSSSTTDEDVLVPTIGPHAITPDYTAVNTVLAVTATASHSDGVRMQIGGGEPIELTQVNPGEFAADIPAYTGLDNDQYTAALTPYRGAIDGETVLIDYVIALPPPGYERYWQASSLSGHVAAVDVLPDGRPVEFGTFDDNGTPRCYLRLREKDGTSVEYLPVLPTAHCRATDLTIDRETGVMHVLLDRKGGDGEVWWVGKIAAWGLGPVNIGTGTIGETATALAQHSDMIAVCGSEQVDTSDEHDALAVLLRPNELPDERLFDYKVDQDLPHQFAETARDCKFSFSGDTLVLVGQARGLHGNDGVVRDRLALLEVDVVADDEGKWTIPGSGPGTQSQAHALDIDDLGRYHLAVSTCADICVPDGEVRVYEPGGALAAQVQLGSLGSTWLGPHDIAWSPAGYAVVALGELQGQDVVFKVLAVDPDEPSPLWTFTPNDKQGQQLGLTAAVGPFGEVFAGGVGGFAVIGG